MARPRKSRRLNSLCSEINEHDSFNVQKYMPPAQSRGQKVPPPTEPGVLPDEYSRLWLFVPAALKQGEAFIQSDTREWFADRNFTVPISRSYPDHPRWNHTKSLKAKMENGYVVSEIHMLARLKAGRAEFPDNIRSAMAVKHLQADVNWRLQHAARTSFVEGGLDAMRSVRDRNPAAYLRLIHKLFAGTSLEPATDEEALSTDKLVRMKELIEAELRKKEDNARLVTVTPMDFVRENEVEQPVDTVQKLADGMLAANGDAENPAGAQATFTSNSSMVRLHKVKVFTWEDFDEE
jgi:hypothetical protein